MVTNTCKFVVGRLLEINVAAGYRTVDDVDAMIRMIKESVATLPGNQKFSIVADWRAVGIMPPETAARVRLMATGTNGRVVRSTILTLPEHSTTNLQVVRIVRESENPARRHFTSPTSLCSWLDEVLSPAESTRLRTFLDAS